MPVALDPNETIAAIASPAAPGLRAIVRLSGPSAHAIALAHFLADDAPQVPSRRARVTTGSMRVDGLRPLLPIMLSLWPAPRTYTGQDVVEIHFIGATPLVNLVLAHCLGRGARQAEPGEFTLRAFLSGRIDLTRAEAVLGVIDATNSAQLSAALEQLAGGVSGPILAMRDHLLDVVAHLEANLDFVDEHDVDPLGRTALAAEIDASAAALAAICRRLGDRENPSGHPRVVLVGPPNAGKSRLFNALSGQDRSIVSAHAGTTRDYVSGLCDCDGVIVELVDTAGIEVPSDTITTQAQGLRVLQTERADLLLVCRSAETADFPAGEIAADLQRLDVWTKGDRAGPPAVDRHPASLWVTSAFDGTGIAELRSAIARAVVDRRTDEDLPAATGARCRGSLRGAEAALRQGSESLLSGAGDELVALDLRVAADELGKVVGAVVTEDILDRIFRRFCIGK